MKKPPELLKHHAILTNWRSYPEGSVERAKAIGMELLATCTNLEATIQLWELKCDIVAKEQAWKPLGLKSREDFIKAVTGRTETVANEHPAALRGGALPGGTIRDHTNDAINRIRNVEGSLSASDSRGHRSGPR